MISPAPFLVLLSLENCVLKGYIVGGLHDVFIDQDMEEVPEKPCKVARNFRCIMFHETSYLV